MVWSGNWSRGSTNENEGWIRLLELGQVLIKKHFHWIWGCFHHKPHSQLHQYFTIFTQMRAKYLRKIPGRFGSPRLCQIKTTTILASCNRLSMQSVLFKCFVGCILGQKFNIKWIKRRGSTRASFIWHSGRDRTKKYGDWVTSSRACRPIKYIECIDLLNRE